MAEKRNAQFATVPLPNIFRYKTATVSLNSINRLGSVVEM
jgi:hypothetical protein